MSKTYIIYKIISLDPTINYCYVGSTQNFTKRKSLHKCCSNMINKNTKLYNTIRENGGWINFEMIPIEEYKCDTPLQARMREQFWIDKIEENKMNSNKAFVSMEKKEYQKEYRAENKDQIAEYNKKYCNENKDKIAAYRDINKDRLAEYRAINKDRIAENKKKYYIKNKDRMAEYRAINKDRKSENNKKYYIENKEKILEKKRIN
jgi:hypothetical protein